MCVWGAVSGGPRACVCVSVCVYSFLFKSPKFFNRMHLRADQLRLNTLDFTQGYSVLVCSQNIFRPTFYLPELWSKSRAGNKIFGEPISALRRAPEIQLFPTPFPFVSLLLFLFSPDTFFFLVHSASFLLNSALLKYVINAQ